MNNGTNPNYANFTDISDAHRTHDLAVSYASYLAMRRTEDTDPDSFYQDYESYYERFSKLVKHYR